MREADATPVETSPDGLKPAQFEKDRRRGAIRGVPVRGFGKSGAFTLWVMPPRAERVLSFVDGKPSISVVESIESPQIAELRDRIIRSAVLGPVGIVEVDLGFIEFAALLLRMNYNLSDDDLAFLLAGTLWHDPIMRHLIGEGSIAALRSLPKPLRMPASPPEPIRPRTILATDFIRPQTWWRRLLRLP